jgi:hypothetical protein
LDADICPRRSDDNLRGLADALGEIDARIRTTDTAEGVRFPCEPEFLKGVSVLNLVTSVGDLDISFVPSGTQGFEDLAARAVPLDIRGVPVRIAALEDIIRSKAAANRPKDHRTLPVLRQLVEELRKRGM